MTNLLEVKEHSVEFAIQAGIVRAVDGVSFRVRPATTVAIVGESGSGKSTVAQAIMGILPKVATMLSMSLDIVCRLLSINVSFSIYLRLM